MARVRLSILFLIPYVLECFFWQDILFYEVRYILLILLILSELLWLAHVGV